MIIRSARSEDAVNIGRIRVNAWRVAYVAFLPSDYLAKLDPQANLDSLRAALTSRAPPFVLKVAEIDGEVCGFSILGAARHAAPPATKEVWALNVDPKFWRKGVGKGLVRDALRCASDSGEERVELWCLSGNSAAQNLYEACGFFHTGATRTTSELTGYPLKEICYANAP